MNSELRKQLEEIQSDEIAGVDYSETINRYMQLIAQSQLETLKRLEEQYGETIDNTLGRPIKIKFVALETITREREAIEKELA